ncbi:tyrosine-type recombinase/integrase [Raoultella sp. C349492]|nr:tyrosine-type recombinase/integrase [Enterobacter sp. 10-1]
MRRRNPYHTRHTFACWLLSAGANPSFIANQMGHGNAKMVSEVYSSWTEEMNGDRVSILNARLEL